jgi:hypothetical protein
MARMRASMSSLLLRAISPSVPWAEASGRRGL